MEDSYAPDYTAQCIMPSRVFLVSRHDVQSVLATIRDAVPTAPPNAPPNTPRAPGEATPGSSLDARLGGSFQTFPASLPTISSGDAVCDRV